MNLKECFHYQNFLNELMRRCVEESANENCLVAKTRLHKKSSAIDGVADVLENVERGREHGMEDVIALGMDIVAEKEAVFRAISRTKRDAEFDPDVSIASNKAKRDFANMISSAISFTKEGVKTAYAYGLTFNAEGNQVQYRYDVEETTVPLYDRNKAALLAKKMLKEANDQSNLVDHLFVTAEVDFEPKFNTLDSFDDIISGYAAGKSE